MEQARHRYITVAYKLFADNEAGIHEIIEEAPQEHPFQFITNLGMALDTFESQVAHLNEGDTFDFTIPMEEAYGPYDESHVISVPKDAFLINGRFDNEVIYPGNYIPLVNEDGHRFEGLVREVKEEEGVVVIDLNSPLAGKALHYTGSIVTAREATPEEIQGAFNLLAGDGCGCGCDCDDHEHDHEAGDCCGGGCGSSCGCH